MSESSKRRFNLSRDRHRRDRAEVAKDLTVGIKVLAPTDDRRVQSGILAYAVVDLQTSLGTVRWRDIRIKWSEQNQRHYIQCRQFPTGVERADLRPGRQGQMRKEYIDVCGPLSRETRERFEDAVVGVFEQILDEASAGTLGAGNPGLLALREQLKEQEVSSTNSEPGDTEITEEQAEEQVEVSPS